MPDEDKLINDGSLKSYHSKQEVFEDVLDDIVNQGVGSWRERKEKLKSELSQSAWDNLKELVGWFDGE